MEDAVDILNKYLKQVPKEGSTMLFRGQADEFWYLDSGATRRLSKSKHAYIDPTYNTIPPEDFNTFIEYHIDIIDRAEGNKYHHRTGRDQTNLELLANLQHFGAATCLIDFTKNFLVALWFACIDEKINGKLFCLDISSTDYFQSINEKDKGLHISEILRFETRDNKKPEQENNKNRIWLWEPPVINNRILQQDSVFVFGKPVLLQKDYKDILKEITIEKKDKTVLLELLKTRFNKTEETLFKDFEGFAYVNRNGQPITTLKKASDYLASGNKKFQGGNYKGSIDEYNKAIERNKSFYSAYYNRGNAKVKLGEDVEAIKDFDEAIKFNPSFAGSYCNRGNAIGRLGNNADAIKDYDIAIKLKPDYALAYFNRGITFTKLGKDNEAIADYDKAIKLEPDSPNFHHSRANAKNRLGNFEGALNDFIASRQLYTKQGNAELAKILAERIEEVKKKIDSTEGKGVASSKA